MVLLLIRCPDVGRSVGDGAVGREVRRARSAVEAEQLGEDLVVVLAEASGPGSADPAVDAGRPGTAGWAAAAGRSTGWSTARGSRGPRNCGWRTVRRGSRAAAAGTPAATRSSTAASRSRAAAQPARTSSSRSCAARRPSSRARAGSDGEVGPGRRPSASGPPLLVGLHRDGQPGVGAAGAVDALGCGERRLRLPSRSSSTPLALHSTMASAATARAASNSGDFDQATRRPSRHGGPGRRAAPTTACSAAVGIAGPALDAGLVVGVPGEPGQARWPARCSGRSRAGRATDRRARRPASAPGSRAGWPRGRRPTRDRACRARAAWSSRPRRRPARTRSSTSARPRSLTEVEREVALVRVDGEEERAALPPLRPVGEHHADDARRRPSGPDPRRGPRRRRARRAAPSPTGRPTRR